MAGPRAAQALHSTLWAGSFASWSFLHLQTVGAQPELRGTKRRGRFSGGAGREAGAALGQEDLGALHAPPRGLLRAPGLTLGVEAVAFGGREPLSSGRFRPQSLFLATWGDSILPREGSEAPVPAPPASRLCSWSESPLQSARRWGHRDSAF